MKLHGAPAQLQTRVGRLPMLRKIAERGDNGQTKRFCNAHRDHISRNGRWR
jgi:hypothetical protein